MNQPKIRILLADDHLVVRMGLRAMLDSQPDMTVIAEAASGAAALREYDNCRPDVVVMDLRMPGGGGVETTAAIRAKDPNARVIVLTTFDDTEDVYRALQAGARAYLAKSTGAKPLLAAIRAVAKGEYHLSPEIAARLAERIAAPELSPRELEILQRIGQGQSNKEIATALFISAETVKTHVSRLFEKLRVHDRAQATAEGIRRGLIRVE
ncbi:MAG: response regulator transcription factor [Verrucomicrobia bacterium]|nr:response regulator transcription factor [Verrucomicrobiota bacterium]